jgi:hypothetical protein
MNKEAKEEMFWLATHLIDDGFASIRAHAMANPFTKIRGRR